MATTACYISVVFLFLYVASTVAVDTKGKVPYHPADELVAIINENRTAHKLSTLYDNPGLSCIALQYMESYEGVCDAERGPDESAFAVTFASNCGVIPSTLAPITGRFLGCQATYVDAPEAFSEILITNQENLDTLYSENHTQMGAAVSINDGRSPYFWCVLFSNGTPNNTFVFEGEAYKIIDLNALVRATRSIAVFVSIAYFVGYRHFFLIF